MRGPPKYTMITIYVPLRANAKSRDNILEELDKIGYLERGLDFWLITKLYEFHKTGEESLNELSNHSIDVVATSSPAACAVGHIAPSRVAKTILVVQLGPHWGPHFQKHLRYAVGRNRPNQVLALVKEWHNEVHERSLRGYIQAEYDIPLTVVHMDQCTTTQEHSST